MGSDVKRLVYGRMSTAQVQQRYHAVWAAAFAAEAFRAARSPGGMRRAEVVQDMTNAADESAEAALAGMRRNFVVEAHPDDGYAGKFVCAHCGGSADSIDDVEHTDRCGRW